MFVLDLLCHTDGELFPFHLDVLLFAIYQIKKMQKMRMKNFFFRVYFAKTVVKCLCFHQKNNDSTVNRGETLDTGAALDTPLKKMLCVASLTDKFSRQYLLILL